MRTVVPLVVEFSLHDVMRKHLLHLRDALDQALWVLMGACDRWVYMGWSETISRMDLDILSRPDRPRCVYEFRITVDR